MNEKYSEKGRIARGLFWAYGERILAQGISLLVSILLARLLLPEQYGIISIVMVFITICDAFVSGGFGNSLVQKKDADDLDFNTMLFCSLTLSVFLYLVLFLAAPYIARFYQQPVLIGVVRVLGLRVPISGLNTIQHARVQKKMEFRKFFFSTLIGTVTAAVVGITMAYFGFGVWALVAQYLVNAALDTIVLLLTNKWLPRFQFSLVRAKALLGYGWKVLVTTLVYTLEGNFRSLVIGRCFGAADLAFYDQGNKFPNVIVSNINASISKVMFPALVNRQDDIQGLKKLARRSIRVGSYILVPLLVGLIGVAETFVKIILSDKWLPCVVYLRILTLVFLVRSFTTTCQQAIMAIGRSDIVLTIEVIINVVAIALTCISVFGLHSVLSIAIGMVVTEMLCFGLYLYYTKRFLDYTHREQIADLVPVFSLSAVMGGIVYAMNFLPFGSSYILLLQIVSGAVLYLLGSYFFRIEAFSYLMKLLAGRFRFVGRIVRGLSIK